MYIYIYKNKYMNIDILIFIHKGICHIYIYICVQQHVRAQQHDRIRHMLDNTFYNNFQQHVQ